MKQCNTWSASQRTFPQQKGTQLPTHRQTALTTVKIRPKRHLIAQKVPIDIVPILSRILFRILKWLGALSILVDDELELCGGIRVSVLAAYLGVEF